MSSENETHWEKQAAELMGGDGISQWEVSEALRAEYERGKAHGADDRRLIEQQNQAQAREIDRLKRDLAIARREAHANANAARTLRSM